MKRVLRFLFWVGAIAFVSYALRRNRLVRVADEPAPPPHFRVPSPNGESSDPVSSTQAALADDLTEINGVGPAYAERLRDAGVSSFGDLVRADVDVIADAIDVSPEQVADWVEQARRLEG